MAARLLAAAKSDIRAIKQHIGASNPVAAQHWAIGIRERCARLGAMPGMGAPRDDVRPGFRILPVGRYLILYRQTGEDAEIVRVVHGARHWQDLV